MTHEDLMNCGVSLKSKAQMGNALEQLHPHIDWNKLSLWKGRFGEQQHLKRILLSLFQVVICLFLFFVCIVIETL
jgi:hypothetical protein